MKENSVKEQKSKKKTKNTAKKIRTIAFCLMTLVVTGTTVVLAWFSLTNQAQVSSLSIQAGTSAGLKIGNTADDVTHESINLKTTDAQNKSFCVKPVTSDNGVDFYLPVYNEAGIVSSISHTAASLSDISNKTEANGGYMISYTVYLLAESKTMTGNVGIRLASEDADSDHAGTYVTPKSGNTTGAEASIRMSFTANNTTTVYEPNANVSVTGASDSQYKAGNWSQLKTVKQTSAKSGLFAPEKALPGASVTYNSLTSDELFKIKVNEVTPVKINIWLEGADKDCINNIMTNDMVCNIQFICLELE